MIETSDVRVVARGDVGERAKRRAREQVAHVTHVLDDVILFARVKLTLTNDPGNPRPALAQVMLDVNGQPVRAVADGPSVLEAVDLMCVRLRRQLEYVTDRRLARRTRGPVSPGPHEWRHGDLPTTRPRYFPRPPEDRQVVRHKRYAPQPITVAEAAEQMTLLDYDFHLFHDVDTHRDAVVERRPDGSVGVRLAAEPPIGSATEPVSTLTIDEAARLLDLSGAHWVFFRDTATTRGAVVYRRYDGHYGVVTAE